MDTQERIEHLDRQIRHLTVRKAALEIEAIEQWREQARRHVGRCFKVNGVYAKVIDIPRGREAPLGYAYNRYQFPALFLATQCDEHGVPSIVPMYEDTIFSGAWGEGNDSVNTYQEITLEEFNQELNRVLDIFRQQIGV